MQKKNQQLSITHKWQSVRLPKERRKARAREREREGEGERGRGREERL